ncbi:MAG: Calx-beta domain-containing protein [Bdellovibrionia bacterium]
MKSFVRIAFIISISFALMACSIESSVSDIFSKSEESQFKIDANPISTSGAEGSVFQVDFTIANPRSDSTSIVWQINSGTTDFTVSGGTITLPPGGTSITLNIPSIDDALFEGAEAFNLSFHSTDSGVVISPANTSFTIVDNDSLPVVEFLSSSSTVSENIGSQLLTVRLTGATALPASVDYSVKASSTANGSDFVLASGTLTFSPGQTTRTLTISINDDAILETTEHVIVELTNPTSASIGSQNEHDLAILDNDTTDLTVTIEEALAQADPSYDLPIEYTVTFNRSVNPATIDASDFSQAGTASGVVWSLNTSDNQIFTLRATAATSGGTIIPNLTAGNVADNLGNNNLASSSTDNSVTYLPAPAAFTITGITGGLDATANVNLASGNFATVNWNASTAADSYDVTIYENDGTTVKCATQNVAAPTLNYNFSTCSLDLATNYKAVVIAKRSNGYNTTATNSPFDFSTPSALSVTINQNSGQSDPTSALPIEFVVVFNRAINPSSFTNSDLVQSGTASGITWTISTSDNISYLLRATAITSEGTVIPSISAGTVTDTMANPNSGSTHTDNSVNYVQSAGAFNISGITGNLDNTADNTLSSGLYPTVNWTTSTGATSYDVIIFENDGSTVKCSLVNVLAPATSYSFSSCLLDASTTYQTRVISKKSLASDVGATNNNFSFTTAAPLTVTVAQGGAQADPTSTLPITYVVTFNRIIDNTSFTTSDITQNCS